VAENGKPGSGQVDPKPAGAASTRLHWVDFLRGLAVLGMIETHAVNSFLAPALRTGSAFAFLSYVNGAVAPVFLFIAGLLQGAWVRKNWDAPKPLGPKLRSLGVILLIGYALQFPWDAAVVWAKVSVALGKVDVLHCIAVTLAALLLLSRCCRRLATYDLVILGLTVLIVVSAPFVWSSPVVHEFPRLLQGYFSPGRGALFPLIPWSAYVLVGALCSRFLVSGSRNVISGPARTLVIAAVTAALIGWLVKFSGGDWLQAQIYAARYDAVLFRVSVVLFCCAAAAHFLRSSHPGLLIRAINWCGSRSLPLYVFHLMLLHSGLGFMPSLSSLFPRNHSPGSVFLLFLLTLGGALILTVVWQKLLAVTVQRGRRPGP
jgi:uncharacterized membrane protein